MNMSSKDLDVFIYLTSIILYHIILWLWRTADNAMMLINNSIVLGTIQVCQSIRISAFRLAGLDEGEIKLKKIYKVKGYTHFDNRKPEFWRYVNKISDPKWVESHPFYPFIHYQEPKKKFDGSKLIEKNPRDIRYSSHIDRYIYEYYNAKLCQKYNKYAKQNGINHASIAYRTNLGKSNIHFSRDVFKFLNSQKNAFIMVSDFTSFFDSLEHKYLKNRLKEILNVETLPLDYYKVFKSITRYSCIEYDDILKELSLTHEELTKLHQDRLFEIEKFRNFKQGKIYINKEKYGMVQGSAISSVMSNIYMIKFDKLVNDLITSINGMYRRYSDDIIIIIPDVLKAVEVYNKLMKIKAMIPNLVISPEKTKCFIKEEQCISSVDIEKKTILKKGVIIDYLGFSYDGKIAKIREKTVAKYYRKMYARIKTINNWTVKKERNIGRRKLYRQYSYLGKKTKDVRKGNFLTYVDRAQNEYKELGDFEDQVKNSWKYMSKRLIKLKK